MIHMVEIATDASVISHLRKTGEDYVADRKRPVI